MYNYKGEEMKKIIICKTAWMQEYNGITNGDIPFNYFENTYKSNLEYTGEIYNFQEFNGKCYGYIQSYGNNYIENYFKSLFEDKTILKGYTIVWCAFDTNEKLKIVGWYKDASIYRNHRYLVDFFPQDSDDNGYDCSASSENVFLIPSENRKFELNDILDEAQMENIIKNPIFYDISYDSEVLNKVEKYISKYKGPFSDSGIMIKHLEEYVDEKLTYEEAYKKGVDYLNVDYTQAIKYINTARNLKETSEVMFYTGKCLQELNCFKRAVEFYARSIELDPENTEALVDILICYAKSGDADNSLNIAKKIIKLMRDKKSIKNSEWLVDAYFIMSNVYVYMNQFNEARNAIKRVLDIRNEAYDKAFVQDVLEIIEDVEEDYFYKM